ncbi:MAG: protein kinase [Alphaproteobacteria bacterium]|nr:protein kinase [Alphaproteobacteria bacterium]
MSEPGVGQDDPFGGLRSGTQIGKYEVVEMLGQGGFGITYRARDTQLRRDVAVKEYLPTSFAMRQGGTTVLPRSTQTAEDFLWGRERFLDEARTLATLEDAPGIVNVYDFMEANGTAYMVMALVRGETLEARLKRDRRLQQPAIEQMLYPLLDGLEKVHEAGFLHRDIKPANILLDAAGKPTLIDFGASRVALQGRTQTLTAVYTPGYAAFEQSTSAKQGPWTDIYALAATLYHCIAGAPPPAASDRMIEDRIVPAAEVGKGRYAPSLLAAIDSGLKLRAAERPQNIAEWRRVLSGFAGAGDSLGAATREMEEPATRRMAAPVGRTERRGGGAIWLVAAAVVVLAVAGGGWLALRPGAETRPAVGTEAGGQDEAAARKAAADKAAADAARRKSEEQAAEARRKADSEAARKAAAEKAAADAARRKAEEDAAAEAKRRAENETARKAAEEKAAAEALAEARRTAEAEAARRAAEEKAASDAAARRKAEADEAARRRAEEQARADAEARRKADEEARRAAEERARIEQAAREKAEAEQARAEAEAKRQAEEAARAAEEKAKAEANARQQAEAGEASLRLTEVDRKRIQVALTALGHNTQGSDGVFGSRTRQMISEWQKSQSVPETGYLTSGQVATLRQQAAAALNRYDEEQRRAEDEKRKTEEEAKRRQDEEARKRAEEERRRLQPAPAAGTPSVATAPATSTGGVDGKYFGELCAGPDGSVHCGPVMAVVQGGASHFTWPVGRCPGKKASITMQIAASGAVSGRQVGFDRGCGENSSNVWGEYKAGKISLQTRGNTRATLVRQ